MPSTATTQSFALKLTWERMKFSKSYWRLCLTSFISQDMESLVALSLKTLACRALPWHASSLKCLRSGV